MTGVAIGIDLGTSGLRAALVDAQAELLSFAEARIAPAQRRTPAAWWDATRAALRDLGDDLRDVRAIAVDGTSGTVLPVDAAGTPLALASLYDEAADPAAVAQVAAAAPADSAARGPTSPLARLLRWRALPGLATVLHEADWLAGRLRGVHGTSDWNNALKTGFDPAALAWPAWLNKVDLDRALLPEPAEPGAALGPIDANVARDLGLPEDTMVAAGTTDGCAAFLATGAAQVGDGVTSLGTTLTLKLLSAVPIAAPAHGVYSHRIGALWLAGGASNSGGGALARHFDPATIAALSRCIDADRPSPCDYYPLPGIGERFRVCDAMLTSRHAPRPADDSAFLHGLLEGIARIEAAGYQRLRDLGGPAVRAVFSLGAGADNAAWSAIRARLLGVPMPLPHARHAAAGAARLALKAIVAVN
jgi:sugar (pentulose or hexulose) kinase